ncbi:MAG: tetraacyldisaccharide 4'-kinase [Thioalkalispiraceae bacterium]
MSSGLENLLVKTWHEKNGLALFLRPVSWLYCLIVILRRGAYRLRLLRSTRLPVPVIVVGNLTVGGTGKTPMVIYLAELMKAKGYHPGIVSRGYKGKARSWPQQVRPDGDPVMVGDEAILISRRSQCPMAVGPDRVAAAEALMQYHDCDIIISDDGLQHYALQRNIEIAVIDGTRRFGNGYCLPAGPLREPLSRLQSVDLKLTNGTPAEEELAIRYQFDDLVSLQDDNMKQALKGLSGQTVHAVAGIGHPQRFFDLLREQGLKVIEHSFPDHYHYFESDLEFDDDYPVIMTEKDAVKCFRFATDNSWYLPISLTIDDKFGNQLTELLESRQQG